MLKFETTDGTVFSSGKPAPYTDVAQMCASKNREFFVIDTLKKMSEISTEISKMGKGELMGESYHAGIKKTF